MDNLTESIVVLNELSQSYQKARKALDEHVKRTEQLMHIAEQEGNVLDGDICGKYLDIASDALSILDGEDF